MSVPRNCLVGVEVPEVLSSEAPIRIVDIEQWMAS
jgi:hypothetical protein